MAFVQVCTREVWTSTRGILLLASGLVEAVGDVVLCHLGHANDFGPGAIGLGFGFGVRAGFIGLAVLLIREEYADTVGHAWPVCGLRAAQLVDAVFGKPLDPQAQHLLDGTQPRWLRKRGAERVDLSDLELQPELAADWVIPSPTGGEPARRSADRRMLWLLALDLGVAASKAQGGRRVDEASAVRLLRRELSDAEWAWIQRGWLALDPEVDPKVVLAMDHWAWIGSLPHSERSLQGWRAYEAEKVRLGQERARAAEREAASKRQTQRPTRARPRTATAEEEDALWERLNTHSTLHQRR